MRFKRLLALSLCVIILSAHAETSQIFVSTFKDMLITASIQSKIAMDSSVSVFKTYVASHDGKVALAGTVETKTDIKDLTSIAKATEGVKEIDVSQLRIKESKHPFKDFIIRVEMKCLLWKEKHFGENTEVFKTVYAETNDGVVYLFGIMNTQEQADNTLKLAAKLPFIQKIQSRITIK